MTSSPPRTYSLLQIWNMSFGFLGIQFGWGLQMANMSAIYQYLGAKEHEIPLLWLAAPVTGLLVQPLVGYYSDHTWTRLGRRRPYFLGGAVLASLALVAMPNSSALWIAAGLLWVLDAAVNVSMEPFRAFVGDLLPAPQRQLGFAMQSVLIGLGAVVSSALPWFFHRIGVGGTEAGEIPRSVHLAFYVGAAVFLASVVYTVVTTPEPPPAENAKPAAAGGAVLGQIFRGVLEMPRAMRRLAVVQFFTWLGLFCMWIYFTPAIARAVFHATPGSADYERAVGWGGLCFSVYNAVAFVAAIALVALARRGFSARRLHAVGLVCAGAGLVSVAAWREPEHLFIAMAGVGVGWATTLSMPYALLANAIPAARMGFYMGVFNLFIVIPQILAATLLGPVVKRVFDGEAMPAVMVGGASFFLAALSLAAVRDDDSPPALPGAAPAEPQPAGLAAAERPRSA